MTPAEHTTAVGSDNDTQAEINAKFAAKAGSPLTEDLGLGGHNIDFPTTANISDCKDEDDMASNSATMLATQQSIKAYIDNKGWGTAVEKDCSDANPQGIAHGGFYTFINTGAFTITDFLDADGDHTDYNEGNSFLAEFADADISVDYSENANIEGNGGVDWTASASQIVLVEYTYRSAR